MKAIQFKIRKALKSDIPAIKKLIKANPKTIVPRSDKEFDELISSFWVAQVKKVIVGCVCLELYSLKICEIRTLIVNKSYSHLGIGKRLMKEPIKVATKLKIPQILVVTSDPAYFKKLNFATDLQEKFALFYQEKKKVKR